MDQNLRTLLTGEPIEPYEGDNVIPGVICYTIVPYVPKAIHVIEPLSYDPASADSRKYQLLSMGFPQLGPYLDGAKPPHAEPGVRSNEVVLAYKVKARPAVVLTPRFSGEENGFPAHFSNCVLCAPLYSLVDENNIMNTTYNPKAIRGVVALKYTIAFPLPTYPYLKSRLCAVRFDRILPARLNCLSKPKAKVTDRWFAYIYEWIHFYATGKLIHKQKTIEKEETAELLGTARSLLLEELSKQKDD